jgi:Ca2+-binding EF-hand superfamily protein
VFDATHKINTAFALYWSQRLERPEVVNPYRSYGFESAGSELLKSFERIPNDAAHDYELVDGWAKSLNIRDWYVWVKYE